MSGNVLDYIAKGVNSNYGESFSTGYNQGQERANQLARLRLLQEQQAFAAQNTVADNKRQDRYIDSMIAENGSQAQARAAAIESGHLHEVGGYLIDDRNPSKAVFAPPNPFADALRSPDSGNSSNPSGNPLLAPPSDKGGRYAPPAAPTAETAPRPQIPPAIRAQAMEMMHLGLNKQAERLIANAITGKTEQGISLDENGNLVVTGNGKAVTNDLQQSQAKDVLLMGDINRVGETFKPEYLTVFGQLKNKYSNVKEKYLGGTLSPEERQSVEGFSRFTSGLEQAFNSYRSSITGAAAAVQELDRLKVSFINGDMSPTQFQASWSEFKGKLQRGMRIRNELLAKGLDPKTAEGGGAFDRQFNQSVDDRYADIKARNPAATKDQLLQMLSEEGY